MQLIRSLKLAEDWCRVNNVPINKTKSTILNIRSDARTRRVRFEQCRGIPVKPEMKYLGVTISDTGSAVPQKKLITSKLKQFKTLLRM